MSEHRDARSLFRQLLPWTIAAACAFGAVWFGQAYFVTKTENADLQNRRALAEFARQTAEVKSAAEQIMSDRMAGALKSLEGRTTASTPTLATPDTSTSLSESARSQADLANLRIATLTDPSSSATPQPLATLVWNPGTQEGLLTVQHLPPLPRGLTYELWLNGGTPVSAGIFRVDPNGRARIAFKPDNRVTGDVRFTVARAPDDGATYHASPGQLVLSAE